MTKARRDIFGLADVTNHTPMPKVKPPKLDADISDKIASVIFGYEEKTGKMPTVIFIGIREKIEMEHYNYELMGKYAVKNPTTCMGLRIVFEKLESCLFVTGEMK